MYGYDAQSHAQFDGLNARIAELQAAFLRIRLARFPQDLSRRVANAGRYLANAAPDGIVMPRWDAKAQCSWHQFVVECDDRTAVMARFQRRGVACGIHYPTPLHRMDAYADAGAAGLALPITEQAADRILSIPVFEGLREEEAAAVACALMGS
jgi:dTDP-4-amino-4,6-dideoxygalactose transaminase